MAHSHRELRESLGAYVLGHLDPGEAEVVQAHLDTCAQCRADIAELGPVAAALSTARPRLAVDAGQVPAGLHARIDAAISAEAGRRRRTRALRSVGAVLVAASVIVLMVIGVVSLLDRAPSTPTPEVVAVVVDSDLDSVDASAGLIAHTWGTEVKLQTTGLDAGAPYRAVVLGAGDQQFPAGTFTGTGADTINCNLQASVLREDARGFRILDARGQVVISSEF
ncbi:MAG: zf-HC2 domain-containing protein [Actinomycetota bacterium]|nr:zf-HC2 domain-containing protein [Actinomycetota bacterium]